jgi:hypothetical protein
MIDPRNIRRDDAAEERTEVLQALPRSRIVVESLDKEVRVETCPEVFSHLTAPADKPSCDLDGVVFGLREAKAEGGCFLSHTKDVRYSIRIASNRDLTREQLGIDWRSVVTCDGPDESTDHKQEDGETGSFSLHSKVNA